MRDVTEHASYLAEARERAAAGINPLIHSLSEMRELILELIDRTGTKSICEIGSEGGLLTASLFELYKSGRIERLTIVEPCPTEIVKSYDDGDRCCVVARPSLEALPGMSGHDLYLVDGDHNYYTVSEELKIIFNSGDPLVVLHDICWPSAERDQYYAPQRIPSDCRHDYTYSGAITHRTDNIVEFGFSSKGNFAIATHIGGEKNGVFGAVHDVARMRDLCFDSIPALFGIGFLRSKSYRSEDTLRNTLPSDSITAFLGRMEENRLENYVARIELEKNLSRLEGDLRRAEDLRAGRVGLRELVTLFFNYLINKVRG